MYSPSAMHSRPWEFIVVKEQNLKNKLAEATPWCDFVKDASVVLVIAARESPQWIEDCSIAAEAIYIEATNQDLGTCFCQILDPKTHNEEYVRQLIKAPKDVRILCLMPLGYPAEVKSEHTEEEFEKSKIHYEKW